MSSCIATVFRYPAFGKRLEKLRVRQFYGTVYAVLKCSSKRCAFAPGLQKKGEGAIRSEPGEEIMQNKRLNLNK